MVSAEVDKNEEQHEAGMDEMVVKDSPGNDSNGEIQVNTSAITDEDNALTPDADTTNATESIKSEHAEEPTPGENSSEASKPALRTWEDQSNGGSMAIPVDLVQAASPPEQSGEDKSRAEEEKTEHNSAQEEPATVATSNTDTLAVPADVPPEVESPEIELKASESSETATLPTEQSDGCQSRSEPISSPSTAIPVEPVEIAEADSVQLPVAETNPRNEGSHLENVDAEDQDGATLTVQELPPTKPSGFLESLTADFAPDTKAMWAQIFGPRYEEDEMDDDNTLEDTQCSSDSTSRESVSSRSSLQAKLARERKLDEQIQASQRRYRERVQRNTAANNTVSRRNGTKASRRPTSTSSPLEQAGLSLTQIRVCTEKAQDETCKFFRRLRAAALEEVEDIDSPLTQGIYITQGELDHLLQELFDSQASEAPNTSGRGRRATIGVPLDFAKNSGFVDGISMDIQLRASWFIPFGQLPHLRSLVMKITKRHLNEEKLAIVNRHLHKQLTLLPLSSRIQTLVVQLSNYQLRDLPMQLQLQSPEELAQDLLENIAVDEVPISGEEDFKNFLIFLPVELVAKTHLPSVICAQRLVFFRFLIDFIAAERARLRSKSTEVIPPVLPDRPPAKRKSVTSKRTRSVLKSSPGDHATKEADTTIQDNEKPLDGEENTSIHRSTAEEELLQDPSMTEGAGDECEKPASQLQQQLESAIFQLRQTLPTLDSDDDHDAKFYKWNPAIRATYLAAVACHKSVLLMLENRIDVDSVMSGQLQHFIEALQAIQTQTNDHALFAPGSPHMESENADQNQLQDPPRFPPPYPESTVPERDDDEEDSNNCSAQTNFPPPYAITSPSYWTFTPSIPEPKSSIAKLASKSPSSKSADLRSLFMSTDSPGVGAYNVQQGDKFTYQRKSSYSFGSSSEGNKVPVDASQSKRSVGKSSCNSTVRQRLKTSLGFVPPEDNDDSGTRVNAASQYDDSHLRPSNSDDLPPYYDTGDANEAPGGKDEEEPNGEAEMDRALRLQQRIFMDVFVQQVVSNQDPPSYFVPRATSSKPKPYWATCEISPGIERLLYRQRRAPSSFSSRAKHRPSPAASSVPVSNNHPSRPGAKRVVKKSPPSPPPRRQLDNDQHLAWAARISELYQPASDQ